MTIWSFETVAEREKLFSQTDFAVEADDFARHQLIIEYGESMKCESVLGGYTFAIGEVDKRQVCVTVFWRRMNGFLVMFYSCDSEVCDWKQIENWLQTRMPKRVPSCNAVNCARCLNFCKEGVRGEKS